MDLGSSIIVAIILTISIIPFMVLRYRNTQQKKIKIQTLTNLAQQQNCNIDTFDSCGDFTIGLDQKKQFLFFHKQDKTTEHSTFIELTTIKSCQSHVHKKAINHQLEIIEKIFLNFKTKENKDIVLEFYNEEHGELVDELQLAYTWEKTVNKLIK